MRLIDDLRQYEKIFGPLSSLAIHPETPGFSTGSVIGVTKRAADRIEKLEAALRFYATPSIYAPHPNGPAFDRRTELYYSARDALKEGE